MNTTKFRPLFAMGSLSLLLGCTGVPLLKPIPGSEPVLISVISSPQATGAIDIRNEALGDNMSAGAGTGVLVGALYGLACGPFAPLCVPLGAAAGAVTGTAAGAAVGVTGALSEEKARPLRDRLNRLSLSHDLLDELKVQVTERARKHWTIVSSLPATTLKVELHDIQLTSTRDERLSFALRVRVTVQRRAMTNKFPPQKLFEYVSPFSSLAVWMDEGSDFLDTSLSSANQQIAAQIISELALN